MCVCVCVSGRNAWTGGLENCVTETGRASDKNDDVTAHLNIGFGNVKRKKHSRKALPEEEHSMPALIWEYLILFIQFRGEMSWICALARFLVSRYWYCRPPRSKEWWKGHNFYCCVVVCWLNHTYIYKHYVFVYIYGMNPVIFSQMFFHWDRPTLCPAYRSSCGYSKYKVIILPM